MRNEPEINLIKKLLNVLEKKEEQEKVQRAAAIQQMNTILDKQGNNINNKWTSKYNFSINNDLILRNINIYFLII